jgi:phage shock protein C
VSDRPATRLLRRSREDRVIAGVCGGLGRYLEVDPVLLRIALVILTVSGGLGVLLYLVA